MKEPQDLEKLLKSIGNRVKELREAKNFTLDDLEFHSNIDSSDINKIELGQRNLTVKTMLRLARGLGVEVRDFFDDNLFGQ